jgi:putative transposase
VVNEIWQEIHMPRLARLDAPGVLRHVIIRGIERRYEMKRLGYNLNTIEDRICEIYKVEKEDIYSRSGQKIKSDARALFCFWAVRELGYGQRELARRLGMTQPGVGYAVSKGEAISKSIN